MAAKGPVQSWVEGCLVGPLKRATSRSLVKAKVHMPNDPAIPLLIETLERLLHLCTRKLSKGIGCSSL